MSLAASAVTRVGFDGLAGGTSVPLATCGFMMSALCMFDEMSQVVIEKGKELLIKYVLK